MKHLFYLMAIVAIIYELSCLFSPKEMTEKLNRLKATKSGDYSSGQNIFVFLTICYISWVIIGLFTWQWYLFLFIFLLSFLPKRRYVALIVIDSFLTLVILLYIIINNYQLHIDTLAFLMNKF